MSQKEYQITSVLQSLGVHDIPTLASQHYKVGDTITTSELRKFCRSTSLIYEAGFHRHTWKGRYTLIRAVDIHRKSHVEAEAITHGKSES